MANDHRPRAGSGTEEWFAFALIAAMVVVLAVWSGAQAATFITTGDVLDVNFGDALAAMFRLAQTPGEPALAWPEPVQAEIPGPDVYWPATVVVGGLEILVVSMLMLRIFSSRVGQARRERLGVNANARFARNSDLRTIIVPGPVRGRFVLGTVNGKLVATENRRNAPTTRALRSEPVARQGDRSAVAVIGPQRSGKTVNVISGILDWDGPAILSSVRDDLYEATFARRNAVGTCFVFDPLNSLPAVHPDAVRVGWSPLQAADTVPGAQRVSSYLLEASPMEGTTNASYFERKGEALLWPILFAAAIGSRSMADVVQWLAIQDGIDIETDPGGAERRTGIVREILNEAIGRGPSTVLGKQAAHALSQFDGFWKLDVRIRSDIYSTSQTLVQPWEDPFVSYSSALGDGYGLVGEGIDLELLLSGRNTLYVVQPIEDVKRFAVVFGGVLGSLLKDQAYRAAHQYRKPLPDLLVVIDEAGNTPLQWLPSVASTCSGIGVLLVTVWQSKAQIDAIYQKQADPLLTNHGSKIFFAGASDEATLRYVSYLGGEEEVHMRTANADVHMAATRRGINDTTTQRNLLPVELLRQVVPGEGLLVHGTLPPAHIKSRRYWVDSRLRQLAAGYGGDLEEWEIDDALRSALSFQMIPSAEVLHHLPDYIPTTTVTVRPRAQDDVSGGADEMDVMPGMLGGPRLGWDQPSSAPGRER